MIGQIFLIVLGYDLSYLNNVKNHPEHYTNLAHKENKMIVKIASLPVAQDKSIKAELSVEYLIDSSKCKKTFGKIIGYFKGVGSSQLNYGDLIYMDKSLHEIEGSKNPSSFDYKKYLKSRNIFHGVYLDSNSFAKLSRTNEFSITGIATDLKIQLINLLRHQIPNHQEFSVISALILGYDDEINRDLTNAYAVTGTIHVLSVSGLHIGIIFFILDYLFKFFGKSKYGKLIRFLGVAVGIWTFAMISGLSPSVIRASLMFTLFLFAGIINRQYHPINTLLSSAFLILCNNPFAIVNVGFQLSYLALGGILIFQKNIYNILTVKNFILEKIWSLTSVSIAAQITTFPLMMYYFHNLSTIFIVSNLLIIPIATLVMYGGIALLLFSFLPRIASLIGLCVKNMVSFMNYLTLKMSDFPFSHIDNIFITYTEMWITFFVVIFIAAFFTTKNKEYLFYSLSFVIVLLISLNFKYYSESNQCGVIIYQNKNLTTIDVFNGYNLLTLGKENKDAEFYRASKHIKNIRKIELKDNQLYHINGHKLVSITNTNIKFSNRPNYVLLRNNPKVRLQKVNEQFPTTKIIADGTNKFSRNLRWSLTSDSLHLDYWSTAQKGAYNTVR